MAWKCKTLIEYAALGSIQKNMFEFAGVVKIRQVDIWKWHIPGVEAAGRS